MGGTGLLLIRVSSTHNLIFNWGGGYLEICLSLWGELWMSLRPSFGFFGLVVSVTMTTRVINQ